MKPNLDRARAWPVTPGTKGRRAVPRGVAWPGALLGVVALLCVGCGGSEEDAAPVIRPVRYQTIFSTGGARTRSFSGLSRASVESRLSFKVPGTVTRVAVSVGDHVKSGQLIADMDPKDYRLQKEEAEASLRRQQAQARNAQADYDRVRALYENGHASLGDLDAARAGSETAAAAVRASEKGLELAVSQLGYTRLTAPVDGAIAAVNVEANENVQAGQTVVVLTSGSTPEVQVAMPEVLIGEVTEGDSVLVTFDAMPGRGFPAVVTEVGVASTGMATTFPVTVRLGESGKDVRAGMAAEVAFRFASSDGKNRIVVPPVAVGEDREGRFAFVVADVKDGAGVARRVSVRTGDLTSEGLEVVEGLSDGDLLVTAGVNRITDGQAVRLLGLTRAGSDEAGEAHAGADGAAGDERSPAGAAGSGR
ncbi:MAG: efflux RND transporter periplasmic adaptor subunit [Candidatus Eisenbacteria bacterium]